MCPFLAVKWTCGETYGQPNKSVEKWQNQVGGVFDNDVLEWQKDHSRIVFRHYGSDIRGFLLEHRLDPLMEKLDAASKKDIKEKAKQL